MPVRHMRYLNHKTTVCQQPALLGEDFLITEFLDVEKGDIPADSCKDCYALVFFHNKREWEREQAAKLEGKGENKALRRFLVEAWVTVAIALVVAWTIWAVTRG